MNRTLILAAVMALAFASGADAKACRDAKGKFAKCPPASAMASAPAAPHCVKGKPCGKSCIAMNKVCHK